MCSSLTVVTGECDDLYITQGCILIACSWRCCMCSMSNEVPQLFDWDQVRNQPGDRWARAELNHGVVEFVAPTEYMVRPPQPAVYVFLIDVSHNAIQSGMVATATRTILENLDRIPNEDNRTKVAFIAFDTSLHFFSLPVRTTSNAYAFMVTDDNSRRVRPSRACSSYRTSTMCSCRNRRTSS